MTRGVAAQVDGLGAVGVRRDDDPAVGVDPAGDRRGLRPPVARVVTSVSWWRVRTKSSSCVAVDPVVRRDGGHARQPRPAACAAGRRCEARGPAPRRLDEALGPPMRPLASESDADPHVLETPHATQPAQRRDRRPRRPRQDHPRRRDAPPGRRLHRAPGRERRRARHGLRRPRAREGHHDPREEHRGPLRRPGRRRQADDDQHHRHPRPRRLRWRGRARPVDGRRHRAARRRLRGPAAADPLRAAQGAQRRHAGDPGRQQDRPRRRPDRRGRRRDLRALHGPARRDATARTRSTSRSSTPPAKAGIASLDRARERRDARRPRPRAAVQDDPRDDPGPDVRRGRAAAGARHQPRRLAVPRPPRAGPHPPGHAEARARPSPG